MSTDLKLPIALGREADRGGIAQQLAVTCAQLAYVLRWAQARATPFSFADFEAADQEKRMQLKRAPWYVCGHFRGNRRVAAELISCSALVFDCDKPGVTRERLLDALDSLGCAYVAATSTSHGVDGQERYRVILPLAQPASPEEYKVLWANVAARLPGVDSGAKDPTRLNYLPRVPVGASGHEVIVRDDRPWLTAPPEATKSAANLHPVRAGLVSNDDLISVRPPPTLAELLGVLVDLAEYDLCDYPDWLQVGAAIHHATDGSDEGLEAYIAYSRCLSNFNEGQEAGEEGCRRRWRSFGQSRAKPVTYGTLVHRLATLRAARGPEKRATLEEPRE